MRYKNTAIRLQRASVLMMVMCFLVAAGRLVSGVAPIFDPALGSAKVECVPAGCRLNADPMRLLPTVAPDGHAVPLSRKEEVQTALESPSTRWMIAAGAVIKALPASIMFLSLAFAFRAFSRPNPFNSALPWLRRAASAALLAVLVQPVADSLRATALSPVSTGRFQAYIDFNGGPFLWGLMLAGAAWIVVWALEEARNAEAELAAMV